MVVLLNYELLITNYDTIKWIFNLSTAH